MQINKQKNKGKGLREQTGMAGTDTLIISVTWADDVPLLNLCILVFKVGSASVPPTEGCSRLTQAPSEKGLSVALSITQRGG